MMEFDLPHTISELVLLCLAVLFFVIGLLGAGGIDVRASWRSAKDGHFRDSDRYDSWLSSLSFGFAAIFLGFGIHLIRHETKWLIVGIGVLLVLVGVGVGFTRGFAVRSEIDAIDKEELPPKPFGPSASQAKIDQREEERNQVLVKSALRFSLLAQLIGVVFMLGLAVVVLLREEPGRAWYWRLPFYFAGVIALIAVPFIFMTWRRSIKK